MRQSPIEQRRKAADTAFEAWAVELDYLLIESEGWNWDGDRVSRVVYYENPDFGGPASLMGSFGAQF